MHILLMQIISSHNSKTKQTNKYMAIQQPFTRSGLSMFFQSRIQHLPQSLHEWMVLQQDKNIHNTQANLDI